MSQHSNNGNGKGNSPQAVPVNEEDPLEEDNLIRDPKPREYLFEKDLINKQNKHIHLVEDFVPSRNVHHLAAKFYARHEQAMPENHLLYRQFVQPSQLEHHCTENQVYGWLPPSMRKTSVRPLSQLNFISAPKQRCYLTVYGEVLQSDQITGRPPFNGLRFHLQ